MLILSKKEITIRNREQNMVKITTGCCSALRQSDDNQDIIYDNSCEYFSIEEFNHNFNSLNGLSILNLNICSLSKIDKLKEYLKIVNYKFSVIAIQETWLTLDSPLDYFNLQNYCLETVNRIDCQVGGVGLYILNDMDYKLRDDLMCQNEICESIFIEVNRPNYKKHNYWSCLQTSPSWYK